MCYIAHFLLYFHCKHYSTAKEFATFFLEKIENICDLFTGIDEFKPAINEHATPLENFSPLTCNEVRKEIIGINTTNL